MPDRERGERWLVGRARPQAHLRLYCFPHSGGSAGEYLRVLGGMPGIETKAIQLPGRGARIDESPLLSLPELAAAIADEVVFSPPYAMFGHSLGGLVAYEVAVALDRGGHLAPSHVVVSACRAPQLPRDLPPARFLSDPELADLLAREYEPLPENIRADAELLAHALSAYRADLHLLETYQHQQPSPVLRCPLTVIRGDRDAIDPQQARGWSLLTDTFRDQTIPGGHFPFRTDPVGFAAAVAGALSNYATAAPGR